MKSALLILISVLILGCNDTKTNNLNNYNIVNYKVSGMNYKIISYTSQGGAVIINTTKDSLEVAKLKQ